MSLDRNDPGLRPDGASDTPEKNERGRTPRPDSHPVRLPTQQERVKLYWENRRNAESVYAAHDAAQRSPAGQGGRDRAAEPRRAAADSGERGGRGEENREAAGNEKVAGGREAAHNGGGLHNFGTGETSSDGPASSKAVPPPDGPDRPDRPTLGALLNRVAELEAGKAASDRRVAELEAKAAGDRAEIAELRKDVDESRAENAGLRKVVAQQGKDITDLHERFDRLEAYADQMTTAIRELRQGPDKPRPATDIAERFRDGDADGAAWRKPQHKRHLPTDSVNNVISVVVGGALTELAFHLRHLSPEIANIGAYAAGLGVGIIAVLRDRRRAKDDADHRPED